MAAPIKNLRGRPSLGRSGPGCAIPAQPLVSLPKSATRDRYELPVIALVPGKRGADAGAPARKSRWWRSRRSARLSGLPATCALGVAWSNRRTLYDEQVVMHTRRRDRICKPRGGPRPRRSEEELPPRDLHLGLGAERTISFRIEGGPRAERGKDAPPNPTRIASSLRGHLLRPTLNDNVSK